MRQSLVHGWLLKPVDQILNVPNQQTVNLFAVILLQQLEIRQSQFGQHRFIRELPQQSQNSCVRHPFASNQLQLKQAVWPASLQELADYFDRFVVYLFVEYVNWNNLSLPSYSTQNVGHLGIFQTTVLNFEQANIRKFIVLCPFDVFAEHPAIGRTQIFTVEY